MKVLKIAVDGTLTLEEIASPTEINRLVAGEGNWAEFYPFPQPSSLALAIDELPKEGTPFNWEASRLITEISGDLVVRLFGTVVIFASEGDIDLAELPERVSVAVKANA